MRSKPGIGGDFIRVLALLGLWGVLLSTTSIRASSQPAEPAWTKLTDPLAPGGYINALAQAPSNPQVLYTLLNSEDGLRVYRSQDGAASWNDLSTISGWVTKLSVDPGDAQTVYALSYSELLKSSDGGHSWSPIRTGVEAITVPLAGTIYAMVNATQSDLLCSSYTYDLLYSPDGGVTWLPLKQFCADHVQFIMADLSNPATMYITGVLFTSKDQNSAIAWKSTDSGTHWDPIPVIWEAGLTDFAIDANAPQHLFVSGADGFFFSLDGGVTWQQADASIGNQHQIVVSDGVVYAMPLVYGPTSLYRSDNDGLTWWTAVQKLPSQVSELLADPIDAGKLLAGFYGQGIYLSQDGGGAWEARNDGIATRAGIRAGAVAPSDSNVFYLAGATPYPAMYRTTDGGQTWSLPVVIGTTGITTNMDIFAVAVHPSHPEIAWAISQNTLFETLDGQTWTAIYNDMILEALAVSPDDGGRPYLLANGGTPKGAYILRSQCDAPTKCIWIEAPVPGLYIGTNLLVSQRDSDTILVGGNIETPEGFATGFYKSLNGGASWNPIGQIDQSYTITSLAAHPSNFSIILASMTNWSPGSVSTVYRSLDGGVSWHEWANGLPDDPAWRNSVVIDELGNAYYNGNDGVYSRTTGGESWLPAGLQAQFVYTLAAAQGNTPYILAATDEGLWRLSLYPVQRTWLPLIRN